MSRYTITSDLDNQIIRTLVCKPEWIELQVKENETCHDGNFPHDEFTYNSVGFERKETLDKKSLIHKSSKELSMNIMKELKHAGIALPMHDESMRSKMQAKRLIDQAAGRARCRFASPGNMIEEEYNQAKRFSIAFLLDDTQSVPPMVQSWATASNRTPVEAAQNIVNTGLVWEQILNVTYDLRIRGKSAVDSATVETFVSVAENYINQLDAI